jgi:hypothetical protein
MLFVIDFDTDSPALTEAQLAQVAEEWRMPPHITVVTPTAVVDETEEPELQVRGLIKSVQISPSQWGYATIAVRLPANELAGLLLFGLYSMMNKFPHLVIVTPEGVARLVSYAGQAIALQPK